MSDEITEALLELHYHRAIVDLFALSFGAGFMRMLKPSTQQEMWVGFDQGWVHTTIPTTDLYNQLSGAIAAGKSQAPGFHLGYFLQFKVVRTMQRRSRLSPAGFIAPYFRSELSVWPSPNSGLSQHETLRRLAQIEGALVYYACPLLFDVDKIYQYPDLNSLQVVDVQSAPPGIKADDRHFVAFQGLSDLTPVWCSEPYPGRGQRGSEWVHDTALRPRRRTTNEVRELIGKARNVMSEDLDEPRAHMGGAQPWLPQSFTILSFSYR